MESKPRKIKVLYTIPNFDTAGSGKALLKIAERLDKEQFEPHICCMHDRGVFFQTVKDSGIPVHIFPYTADMSNRLRGLLHVCKVSRFFKAIKPDIIHSFHYAPDYSEGLAAKLAGIKWIYTKKNMNWGGSSKNGWRLRSWLAHGIIAQNSDMLKDFFPGWEKVKLIPRGVDTTDFFLKNHGNKPALRNELGLSPQHWVILTVANLVPVKGVELIIQAVAKLQERYHQINVVVVGDDQSAYGQSLKTLCRQLGMEETVDFTGKVLHPHVYYHAADTFVLSSLKESSPVALLEAMASGVPVIASKTAGAMEFIGDFEEQLFAVGNYTVLAQKLEWLMSLQAHQREQIIARQLTRIRGQFSIEIEVARHQEFYLKKLK